VIKVVLNPLFYVLIGCFLASCSTVDISEQVTQPEDKKKALVDLLPESWSVRGRIAVLHPDENWHAHFVWRQKKENYQLKFSGPLGQTQLFVEHKQNPQTNEQFNTLIMGDNKYQNNQSMELLLEQFSPVNIPLTSLKYWLYGQPNPYTPFQVTKDKEEKIIQLHQLGWLIDFKKYQNSLPWVYPNKITAQKRQHKIKVFIKQREFEG